jgi:tetratricopeptide (TPR) repeat protein
MPEEIQTLEQALALAVQQHRNGDFQDAEASYMKLLQANPNHYGLLANLGVLAKQRQKYDQAKDFFLTALKIKPQFAGAHHNLGNLFQELGQYQKAQQCYQKALQIDPHHAHANNSLGFGLHNLGEHEKAQHCFEESLRIEPDYPAAHCNLGITLLLHADFKKGFDEYEWRKKLPAFKKPYKKPDLGSLEWQGEDLNGKTILIFSEQGLGDTIHFARYVYLLEEKYTATIIFYAQKRLVHLFQNNSFEVITDNNRIPVHDYHIYLMSLPRIFHKETKSFPQQINYIPKNQNISSKWVDKLFDLNGIKVGINWQGSKTNVRDKYRSIPLDLFEPLFNLQGIDFISLQRGYGTAQINGFKYKDRLVGLLSEIEIDSEENAFEETIGLLQHLDLVITVDTALAHLSSTLGLKTWVLLPITPDWRWFLDSEKTPWYESTKLYRQEKFNDWRSIIALIQEDLLRLTRI